MLPWTVLVEAVVKFAMNVLREKLVNMNLLSWERYESFDFFAVVMSNANFMELPPKSLARVH